MWCDKFTQLHQQYDDVFNPAVAKYNGFSGKIEAVVNMGPSLPPQRKGRLPQYNTEMLLELQAKFDELEKVGVFATPEQVNVNVEYLNLSFLVKKPHGGHRLVTSFGEVGRYSKPQPSLMPQVDNVLRDIAKWRYIIVTDLLKSFYQIPLICPQSATILGWVWSKGTIRASSHRLLALESATPPTTVHGLRSFIGAYKVLNRVLKGYALLLKPLETIVAGMPSREKINWTDDLLEAFFCRQICSS